MYNNLPDYYKKSEVVKTLGSINKEKLEDLNNFIYTSLDNLFIEHSKELRRYEAILGLPVQPTISEKERIARIKSKLQGTGTTTLDALKNICENFTNDEVEIVENNSNYEFLISFFGSITDSKELFKHIEEVKPAHLNYKLIAVNSKKIKIYEEKTSVRKKYYKANQLNVSVKQKNTIKILSGDLNAGEGIL